MLTIDGSIGEGGGQILRIALAWSALRSEPVKIVNIREKRPKSGLKPQHLTTLLALKEISAAEVKGAYIGSKEVEFIPSKPEGGIHIFDCGTAGSITLMIQAILPVLLMADRDSKIVLRGGTDVKWSPPVDHTINVLLPALKKMGADVGIEVIRRGYYPEGGGEVALTLRPSKIRSISLKGGYTEEIHGKVHYSNLPAHVPERIKLSALKQLLDFRTSIVGEKSESISTGTGISLWAQGDSFVIGSGALGERGLKAEIVGRRAGKEMKEYAEKGAGADPYLADQLLIYMAMAGDSEILTTNISSHAKTAITVLQRIGDVRFYVDRTNGLFSIRAEKD